MPAYYSYIAKLNSPDFFWKKIPDDRFRLGNIPGPKIIPQGYGNFGYAPEFIEHWTKNGGFEGKQIDSAAWGMVLRKSDIEVIWKSHKDCGPWDGEAWLNIWKQIEMLADDQMYIWVVAENP